MKKVISIALALLMVAVMLPVMAMAEDPATELPPADANGLIKLTKDVTLSSFAKIDRKTTIDLNGHTITCTYNWAIVVEKHNMLTIVDSSDAGGAIVCTDGEEGSRTAIFGGDYTGIIIEGGHIKGVDYGVVLMGKSSSLTVNGGVIEGGDAAISGNGSLNETTKQPLYGNTQIKINGGKVIGGNAGIYQPQNGNLTINNGEITGKTGIEVRAGSLTVDGGTITATGDTISTNPNGNGTTTVGAAIAVVQHTTKQPINVKINGGSFNGVSALYEANPQDNPKDATKQVGIVVDGGTFNGAVNKADDGSSLGVMDGTFNSDVTAYVGDTLAVTDGNNYYVGNAAQNAVQNATGGTITVKKAKNDTSLTVKPGVTVENGMNDGKVTVNGNEVKPDGSYTVPGAPIIIYTPDNEPAILSGANQVVAPGAAATFRIDEEYDRLLAVAVDGVTLDKSNYEAWSGSTYIKLLPKFMKTLSVGTHTLTAYFTSHTVSPTFTISEGAKNPATGANDFVGVAAAMAVVSLLGAAAVIRKK